MSTKNAKGDKSMIKTIWTALQILALALVGAIIAGALAAALSIKEYTQAACRRIK